MADESVHFSCGLAEGSPWNHAGVFLSVSFVTDGYNVQENILKAVSKEIPAHALCAITPVFESDVYKLYIHGVEHECEILRKGVIIDGEKVEATPLFSYFTISNVYPFVKNEPLIEMFSEFGKVVKVEHVYACPNSTEFGHVLTDKRRVVFQMPPRTRIMVMPKRLSIVLNCVYMNVSIVPYCSACMSDGHSITDCPEMISMVDDDKQFPLHYSSESDDTENEPRRKFKKYKRIQPFKREAESISDDHKSVENQQFEKYQDKSSIDVSVESAAVMCKATDDFHPRITGVVGSGTNADVGKPLSKDESSVEDPFTNSHVAEHHSDADDENSKELEKISPTSQKVFNQDNFSETDQYSSESSDDERLSLDESSDKQVEVISRISKRKRGRPRKYE